MVGLVVLVALSLAQPVGASLDPTPPIISPAVTGTLGNNGWYVSDPTVRWTVTDPESGIVETSGCDTRTVRADTTGFGITCSATNGEGLSGSYTLTVKLDKTAPAVTAATPDHGPNASGWYNATVAYSFSATDATSGVNSCAPATYGGPDSANASITGTCRDTAGNNGTRAFPLKYDETAPAVTTAPDRAPNAAGWYRAPVTVTFDATDAVSGNDSCDPAKTYTGPDAQTASVTGTCRDVAGNIGSRARALKYDATAPTGVTGAAARAPNANGWYRAAVDVGFDGTDATSDIASCTSMTYSGPDGADRSILGSCRDNAGNMTAAAYVLDYDETAPSVTGKSPSRLADRDGWYNHDLTVTYTGSDATSGMASCDTPSYGGPDDATASVLGVCRDRAGNTSPSSSFAFKYDETAPAITTAADRLPNAAGWYRAPVTVTFDATDAVSGKDSCDPAKTYIGPDAQTASLTGTCRDIAGNVGSRTHALRYDETAPAVETVTPARQANAAGWYKDPIAFAFGGSDSTSGISSCPDVTYSGPDGGGVAVIGRCTDRAGNPSTRAFPLKYDETLPTVTTSADRPPNGNGWYREPVTVSFAVTDALSGPDSCDLPKTYSGPNDGTASLSGICRDKAGNSASRAHALKYDATAPTVTGAEADRPPNATGWYKDPVDVSFEGSDATSGIGSCPTRTYGGPDGTDATVTGTCTDRAGNQSAAAAFPVKFDGTAPTVTGAVPARSPDSGTWYRRAVSFTFTADDPISGVTSCSPATYSGPDRASARVTGRCADAAGNVGARAFVLRYDATAPTVRATFSRRPDRYGWYSHDVRIRFRGTDSVSGVASCSPARLYGGPNDPTAFVRSACTDRAGNRRTRTFGFRYSEPLLFPKRAPEWTHRRFSTG